MWLGGEHDVIAHTFNSITLEAEVGESMCPCVFEAKLNYLTRIKYLSRCGGPCYKPSTQEAEAGGS